MESAINNDEHKQRMLDTIRVLVKSALNMPKAQAEEMLTLFTYTHYNAVIEFMTDAIINSTKLNEISRLAKTTKLPYVDTDDIINIINITDDKGMQELQSYDFIQKFYAAKLSTFLKPNTYGEERDE